MRTRLFIAMSIVGIGLPALFFGLQELGVIEQTWLQWLITAIGAVLVLGGISIFIMPDLGAIRRTRLQWPVLLVRQDSRSKERLDAITPIILNELRGITSDLTPAAMHIMKTAERLFALQSLDVSTREIVRQSGHKSPSALLYHFGSKNELISAILDFRKCPLNSRYHKVMKHRRNYDYISHIIESITQSCQSLQRSNFHILSQF